MKKIFFLIILSILCITATAQVNDNSTQKIFHYELKMKQVDLNIFSDCKLIDNTFTTDKGISNNTTFMKEERMPSQQQIKINYIHKPYEPTLIEAVGSFVYDILEENMYNNWKH